MKKLTIYKSASDFAFKTLGQTDPLALSEASNTEFRTAGFDGKDYPYWSDCFNRCRSQFQMLSQQDAPSVKANAPAPAAPEAKPA
jgi:hypothetical protein